MNGQTDRMDELESRLAFQDDLIESLNEVVARQDREIADAERQSGRVDRLGEGVTCREQDGAGEA